MQKKRRYNIFLLELGKIISLLGFLLKTLQLSVTFTHAKHIILTPLSKHAFEENSCKTCWVVMSGRSLLPSGSANQLELIQLEHLIDSPMGSGANRVPQRGPPCFWSTLPTRGFGSIRCSNCTHHKITACCCSRHPSKASLRWTTAPWMILKF